jgi:hypothetical protein
MERSWIIKTEILDTIQVVNKTFLGCIPSRDPLKIGEGILSGRF